MARTSAKKASQRPGQKAKRAESPPRKRTGAQRAAPKPASRRTARKGTTKRAKAASRPKARRLSPKRKQEILAKVARPRKQATHGDALPVEEHQHQDPRLLEIQSGNPGDTQGPKMNYGEYKNKAVARMDPPGNWYRKAPKAPEK